MSEHYWADGTLKGELETLLCGPVGGLLQKWQKKAIRKAMKQVDKASELKHWFKEVHRLGTCGAEIEEIEKQASLYQWIANNCEVTYNGETIYDETQLKQYKEEQ